MKGRGMAGLNANPLVSENRQSSLERCHHSPLKVLKNKRVGYERRAWGWKKSTLESTAFDPPFYFHISKDHAVFTQLQETEK